MSWREMWEDLSEVLFIAVVLGFGMGLCGIAFYLPLSFPLS
jgi:hypothetical protein